ncbi:ABC transporter permease subunit [Nonomuraea dietziae]|uniref:ABC transporter permease subunit n=1 Tax=Nonomuraea dietziae TaxID=65515 RepID=UPI0031DAA03D
MLIEAVGGNAEASRLAGIRARGIIVMVYAFAALCAGVAGLMISSNVSSADGNNAGAVDRARRHPGRRDRRHVAGRRALLTGGDGARALIIQTLTTTIYSIGVPPETRCCFRRWW